MYGSLEGVSGLLRKGLEDGAYPSYALGVGRFDSVLYLDAGGVESYACGTPVTDRTRYDMASLTKVIATSMVAFRAVEEGRLSLYDTLGDLCGAPEDKREITIWNLMTHTSGMSPSFPIEDKVDARGDLLACLLKEPLESAPGTRVAYSCMGYLLLAALLEGIYGERLDALAERVVYAPLGMRETGFIPVGAPVPEHVAATEFELRGVVHDEKARHLGGVAGNAGAFSTLRDMTAFARMLACSGELDGTRVIGKALLREAIRCHTPGMEQRRGLGFHLGGVPFSFMGEVAPADAFGHTGFTGTSLVVDPHSGVWTVLLTNRVHPSRDNLKLMRVRRLAHNMIYTTLSE